MREKLGDRVLVDYAMRYGSPSIATGLARFREAGVSSLIVLPLFKAMRDRRRRAAANDPN